MNFSSKFCRVRDVYRVLTGTWHHVWVSSVCLCVIHSGLLGPICEMYGHLDPRSSMHRFNVQDPFREVAFDP